MAIIPIKVTSETSFLNDGVKKSQLIKLVEQHYTQIQKKDKYGKTKKLDKKLDAKAIWFSMKNLNDLFKANSYKPEEEDKFGLRIYLCVHDKNIIPDIDPAYDNQQTVILVVTKAENDKPDNDQLPDNAEFTEGNFFVEICGFARSEGLNHGKICPPSICDGSKI